MQIIGGEFKKRKLYAPKGEQTRPSKNMLRETFFNICMQRIAGCIFVDVFAGSGAMGFEALSRGAKHVYLIENHKNALAAIQKNIELLKVHNQVTLLKGDAFAHLLKIKDYPDLVFADPPYAKDPKKSFSLKLLSFLDTRSFLDIDGRLYLEMRKNEEINYNQFESFEMIKKRVIGDSQLVELKQVVQ